MAGARINHYIHGIDIRGCRIPLCGPWSVTTKVVHNQHDWSYMTYDLVMKSQGPYLSLYRHRVYQKMTDGAHNVTGGIRIKNNLRFMDRDFIFMGYDIFIE